jgi:hypothetical protein
MKLTNNLHLVPRPGMRQALPPRPLRGSIMFTSWWPCVPLLHSKVEALLSCKSISCKCSGMNPLRMSCLCTVSPGPLRSLSATVRICYAVGSSLDMVSCLCSNECNEQYYLTISRLEVGICFVSKSFRTGRLERELQMVQLSATNCSCNAILWVSLMSFATITLCVASQWVFIVVSVYFFMTQSGNFWIHPPTLLNDSTSNAEVIWRSMRW